MANREVPFMKHWMTATDAAHALGKTRQTVNKMIQQGDLKTAMRLGSRLYIVKRSEVETLAKANAAKSDEQKLSDTLDESAGDFEDTGGFRS